MKIVCDDRIPFLKGVLEPYAEVVYKPGAMTTCEDVRNADALITRTRTMCGSELLAGSKVKLIATATIGFDHIDTEWCASHGVDWVNAPGCNSSSVRQYVASALCEISRRFSLDLSGKKLGVVGAGNVGSKVIGLGHLLGMEVLVCDPIRATAEESGGYVSIDRICECCDVVTVHVPLVKDGQWPTMHLFDAKRLGSLKNGAVLINSSRGAVVDNMALLKELESGRIRAVLDVWENEPRVCRELLGLCSIATPHIAGYSADGKAMGTAMAVRAISRYFGLPLNYWYPDLVPAPQTGLEIMMDTEGRDCQWVLRQALLKTYDIMSDDALLRENPEGFEFQRGHYPIRREPSAYTVCLSRNVAGAAEVLKNAGFGKVVIQG